MHQCGSNHFAIALALLDGNHALGAPTMPGVLGNGCTLAITILRSRQHTLLLIFSDQHGDDVLAIFEHHAPHTARRAAHGTHVVFIKAHGFATVREKHHVMLAVGQRCADQEITIIQIHGNNAGFARIVEVIQWRFLDCAHGCGHEHILVCRKSTFRASQRQYHGDFFTFLQREHVDNRSTACTARTRWHFPDLQPVQPSTIGKTQYIVVCIGNEQLVNPIIFFGSCCLLAAATTFLSPVF